jgi:predicted permease
MTIAIAALLPDWLVASLRLLGSTTSDVFHFASGLIPRTRTLTPAFSIPIVVSMASRLAVVPALTFVVFPLDGCSPWHAGRCRLSSRPIQIRGEGERLGLAL